MIGQMLRCCCLPWIRSKCLPRLKWQPWWKDMRQFSWIISTVFGLSSPNYILDFLCPKSRSRQSLRLFYDDQEPQSFLWQTVFAKECFSRNLYNSRCFNPFPAQAHLLFQNFEDLKRWYIKKKSLLNALSNWWDCN